MAQELPEEFRMKDLFIDVRLEACVNGSTFDFLGKKLFSAEFFRESLGFGITSIDIEINTSLQPIVTIVFKDLYGGTIFGGQDRKPADGLSIDYSVIFNWPPPKFLFSFKGYLGKPATWLLNLKRTSTSFNSSDGSYDLKCEFVPNQWGFFADMPFLYLLAAKRLRKDKLGPVAEGESQVKVTSVFDLIKIGKQVEIKTQDTTKEFDDLVKQLGAMKSNIGRALVVTDIVEFKSEIIGSANNQPVKDFVKITIPSEEKIGIGNRTTIEGKLSQPSTLNAVNAYLLLAVKWQMGGVNSDGFTRFGAGISRDFEQFYKDFSNIGSPKRLKIDAAKQEVLTMIQKNLEKIDDEIKRRVFATSETKLEKITIGEIFSQLAKDAAFVMGSILDAGLDGYRGDTTRTEARDALEQTLIGESFPLMLAKDGEEVPATKDNLKEAGISADIGVDNFEMKFVKNFISAISEGIAKDLLANNPQAGESDSTLKQRVNNMEISSGNPYKSYYDNIASNILIRGGIAGYYTRSADPNLPGDFGGGFFRIDRDDINSIQELAQRDMENITPSILTNLSDVDFLLLRRFCLFFTNFWTSDAEDIAHKDKSVGLEIAGASKSDIDDFQVVLQSKAIPGEGGFGNFIAELEENNLIQSRTKEENAKDGFETLTFGQLWKELYTPAILIGTDIVGDALVFNTVEEQESRREDQVKAVQAIKGEQQQTSIENTFSTKGIKNAQNPLSFVSQGSNPVYGPYNATRIVNNGIAYAFINSNSNDYYAVFFEGEDNKRAQEANSAPTDGEFKNKDKDTTDTGQNEVLGYVPINAKYGDDNDATEETDSGLFMLNRVASISGYRRGTTGSEPGNVLNFTACKNPSPGFYGSKSFAGNIFALESLRWEGAILSDPSDASNVSIEGREIYYAGNIGWTVCTHVGSDVDSGLVFGLFSQYTSGRNQRAFITKAASVLLEKIDKIIDGRNQVIGEVLGKAGDNEGAIYKQMHTLFHQWQTLSYSDTIDKTNNCLAGDPNEHKSGEGGAEGRVFNVSDALEKRFGDNHADLKADEKVSISRTQLLEETGASAEELEQDPNDPNNVLVSVADCNSSSTAPNGTFIYDYPMQRIAKPEEPINVRDSIINLESLYKPNANTSILNIIQQICSKNNFMFIPIPGDPGYLCVNEIYKPSMRPANLEIKNFFHVLFTPTPESRAKTKNTDGTPLGLSDKQDTYNVGSFVIKYGHPDNQIVKSVSVGTDDNKVTAESIVNLQRLVDNENQNKKVTTDCSMLPVLAGRSYKASVDMLGNSQVYPMQFFFLENSPLFGGLYQVMKVKHSISPNDMSTTLDGIRMRFSPGDGYGSIKPITLQTFRSLGESDKFNYFQDGFDKVARDALSNFVEGIGIGGVAVSGDFHANLGDYVGISFVDGKKGGCVAQSVPTIPQAILDNSSEFKFLGLKDLWSKGKITGSGRAYKYDRYPLIAKTLSAFKAMKEAAIADGVDLKLTSGLRAYDLQYSLRKKNSIDRSLANNDNHLRTASSKKFHPETARPGWSNHNSGIAIDMNCGGNDLGYFNQGIYEWLMLNACKYGFVRTVRSEEWHWEYRPGSAMFQFCDRSNDRWHGLVEKLGIPLNQPTSGDTSVTVGNN